MPYTGIEDDKLPDDVKIMSDDKKSVFVNVFNSVFEETADEGQSFAIARSEAKKYKTVESSMDQAEELGLDDIVESSYSQSESPVMPSEYKNRYTFLACEVGTAGTTKTGKTFRYTEKSLKENPGAWIGMPFTINHMNTNRSTRGKLVGAVFRNGSLYHTAETDDVTSGYIDNKNYEGFSIGTQPTDVDDDGNILSFKPDHSTMILLGRMPADKNTAGTAVMSEDDMTTEVTKNDEIQPLNNSISEDKCEVDTMTQNDEKIKELDEKNLTLSAEKETLSKEIEELKKENETLLSFKKETEEKIRDGLVAELGITSEMAKDKSIADLEFAKLVLSSKSVPEEKPENEVKDAPVKGPVVSEKPTPEPEVVATPEPEVVSKVESAAIEEDIGADAGNPEIASLLDGAGFNDVGRK